jgi:thiol-disulfide isomerase/thioredoxin
MKHLYTFLFLYTQLLAQNTKLVIHGECQNCPDQKVYISRLTKDREIVDTVDLINEKFVFEKRMANEEWIRIRYQYIGGFIELFTAPTESIEVISKNAEPLDQSIINGSPESITRREYMQNNGKLRQFRTSLLDSKTAYEEKGTPVPIELLNRIDSINARIEEMVFETIMNTKSLLLKDLCLMWIKSPVYINVIKMHIDSLANVHQENYDFKNLQQSYYYYLDHQLNLESLDLDKFLMNFSFQSNTGVPITRQNLGGKYLFIEFWASWCKPCRVSNQEINQQQDVFLHEKLYTCFVSLDKDHLKWKEAIAADKLEWANHGIDAFDPEKSFAKSIGVVFIPTNLLVDPNGQVMLINAKPAEIKAFLDKLK